MTRLPFLLILGALALTACHAGVVTEPVGEPARITLRATPVEGALQLDALVDYGPMGGVPATVTYDSGGKVIGTQTERTALQPTAADPWDYKYSLTVPATAGVTYNLFSRVTWTAADGLARTLDSEPVTVTVP